jgi:carboxyl-terminal processing protease
MKTHILELFGRFTIKLSIAFLILFISCSKEKDSNETNENLSNIDSDDIVISLEGALQISDFVWKGLNQYYYWQEQVSDLNDRKALNSSEYAKYINDNPEPEEFFESLKHENDRFSYITSDYVALQNSLQGIVASNGVEFGLSLMSDGQSVFGYVRYIHENSDASDKNIERGDVFTAVDGQNLNVNNYEDLLYGDNLTYALQMADISENTITPNGETVELTKVENFEKNSIHINKVLNVSGKKIGYLMYTQFVNTFNNDLNNIFASFKSEGISDLVLDLRYNGGGSLTACLYLASMITGQFTGEIFAQQLWNSKLMDYWNNNDPESLKDLFVDQMADGTALNSLNLNKVYILTTSRSASASELLINGLTSHIDIIQIGDTTYGKNVGSITVYDYVDNQGTKNPDHTYAMQPIVLKIANSASFADYDNGLDPNIELKEDISNMGVLGEVSEPLLSSAINQITGSGKKAYKAVLPIENIIDNPKRKYLKTLIIDNRKLNIK